MSPAALPPPFHKQRETTAAGLGHAGKGAYRLLIQPCIGTFFSLSLSLPPPGARSLLHLPLFGWFAVAKGARGSTTPSAAVITGGGGGGGGGGDGSAAAIKLLEAALAEAKQERDDAREKLADSQQSLVRQLRHHF